MLLALPGCALKKAVAQSTSAYDFVVAADGSGNFKTVQEAINAVPDFRKKWTTIFIKNGTYKEKIVMAESKQMVSFIGESIDKTIITYDDYSQKKNVFGEERVPLVLRAFIFMAKLFPSRTLHFKTRQVLLDKR